MSIADMLHLQVASGSLVLAVLSKPPEKTGEQAQVSYVSSLSETLQQVCHLALPTSCKFHELVKFIPQGKGPVKTFVVQISLSI